MKNILTLIISALLFTSCQEKDVIEVIPNYDEIYLPIHKIDETPQLVEGDEKSLTEKIDSEIKKLNLSNVKLDYNLMIDEKGNVNKMKILMSPDENLTKIALEAFEDWKFIPGKKDGKSVKSQYRWYFHQSLSELNINANEFLIYADGMPEIVGGINSLQERIKYPEIAKRAGIEGKVFVLTFIDELGNVVDAKVIKGIGSGCDEEALNAIKNTKFTVPKHKGESVKVQVTVPILFKLS